MVAPPDGLVRGSVRDGHLDGNGLLRIDAELQRDVELVRAVLNERDGLLMALIACLLEQHFARARDVGGSADGVAPCGVGGVRATCAVHRDQDALQRQLRGGVRHDAPQHGLRGGHVRRHQRNGQRDVAITLHVHGDDARFVAAGRDGHGVVAGRHACVEIGFPLGAGVSDHSIERYGGHRDRRARGLAADDDLERALGRAAAEHRIEAYLLARLSAKARFHRLIGRVGGLERDRSRRHAAERVHAIGIGLRGPAVHGDGGIGCAAVACAVVGEPGHARDRYGVRIADRARLEADGAQIQALALE